MSAPIEPDGLALLHVLAERTLRQAEATLPPRIPGVAEDPDDAANRAILLHLRNAMDALSRATPPARPGGAA